MAEARESSAALVHRLVAELGIAQLLRLVAEVAAERADAAARQGASPQTARMFREAALLRQAADDILD